MYVFWNKNIRLRQAGESFLSQFFWNYLRTAMISIQETGKKVIPITCMGELKWKDRQVFLFCRLGWYFNNKGRGIPAFGWKVSELKRLNIQRKLFVAAIFKDVVFCTERILPVLFYLFIYHGEMAACWSISVLIFPFFSDFQLHTQKYK